jgi:quinol monooxygenase YgiN
MALTVLLDLQLHRDKLEIADDVLRETLTQTRAFEGCLRVEVLTDTEDPAHVLVVEEWESLEADSAYRAWRAGEGRSNLGSVLAQPGVITRYEVRAGV